MSSTYSTSAPSWYGQHFPAKTVPQMPRPCLLSHGGRLSVDYATAEDESVCRDLILDSAARGRDNVGVDEFSDGLESRLDIMLIQAQVFAARDTETKTSKAFVIITPSLYSRTFDTCLASLFVFRDKELQSDGAVFDQLLRLAVHFAQTIDLGYTNAIYAVASCEHDMVHRLRREGFIRVATIPNGVRIAGVGLCDNFFMVKSLSETRRPRRSADELHRMLDRIFPDDQCNELYQTSVLPTADFLPAKYVFANGLAVICRNMKKTEDVELYEIWKSAAEKGLGYGIDEVPSLTVFRITMLLGYYCIVFEEIATGKIVGMTMISSSYYTRTSGERAAETNVFISEKFRGQKLGSEALSIELSLMKQLGFKSTINDTLSSNYAMLATLKRTRVKFSYDWIVVGVIPDGCFTEGYGWDDQLIDWFDFNNDPRFKNFSELAIESWNRDQTKSPTSKL